MQTKKIRYKQKRSDGNKKDRMQTKKIRCKQKDRMQTNKIDRMQTNKKDRMQTKKIGCIQKRICKLKRKWNNVQRARADTRLAIFRVNKAN